MTKLDLFSEKTVSIFCLRKKIIHYRRVGNKKKKADGNGSMQESFLHTAVAVCLLLQNPQPRRGVVQTAEISYAVDGCRNHNRLVARTV
jgi:hypothetical protein